MVRKVRIDAMMVRIVKRMVKIVTRIVLPHKKTT